MKKLLSFFAGSLFVLAFGIAYGDELQPESAYTSDKMIRNEDLQKYDQDQGPGPFNQLPALPEAQGSGAGGGSREDLDEMPAPDEKDATKPSDDRGGSGGQSRDWEPYRSLLIVK